MDPSQRTFGGILDPSQVHDYWTDRRQGQAMIQAFYLCDQIMFDLLVVSCLKCNLVASCHGMLRRFRLLSKFISRHLFSIIPSHWSILASRWSKLEFSTIDPLFCFVSPNIASFSHSSFCSRIYGLSCRIVRFSTFRIFSTLYQMNFATKQN